MIINNKLFLKINQLSTDKKQFKNIFKYDEIEEVNSPDENIYKKVEIKEKFQKQQKELLEYLESQRIKYKSVKQIEEQQLLRCKKREIRLQKRLMSAGVVNQTKSFVTAVPIRDQFSKQGFLLESLNNNKIAIESNNEIIKKPSLQSSKRQSIIKTSNQRPQTSDNSIPKIHRYTQLLQQNPWRPPSSVGQCFDKRNVFELDEKTKQNITDKQQFLYQEFLKTAQNKFILEENLIKNGQLGWKCQKANCDVLSYIEKNIFSRNIKEKKQKFIPFKPTKSIGQLFSENYK